MANETDDPSAQNGGNIGGGNVTTGDIVNSKAVAVGHSSLAITANEVHIHIYPADIQAQTANEATFAMQHGGSSETLKPLPTSLPAIVLESALIFEDVPVQLGRLEQFIWHYPSTDVPKGWANLGGVQFQLQPTEDGRAVGLAVRPSPQNEAETISIPVGLANVGSVFMLITTGWGLKRIKGLPEGWEGEQIGVVRLRFEDGSKQEQRLVLGDNIRDWAIGTIEWAVTETTAPSTIPVWVSPTGSAALDLLRIEVDGGPKTLERIEIVAHMISLKGQTLRPVALWEGDKQIAPPSFAIIQVSGITCRVHQD